MGHWVGAGGASAARDPPPGRDQSPHVRGHCSNSIGMARNAGVRHRGSIAHDVPPRPRKSSKRLASPLVELDDLRSLTRRAGTLAPLAVSSFACPAVRTLPQARVPGENPATSLRADRPHPMHPDFTGAVGALHAVSRVLLVLLTATALSAAAQSIPGLPGFGSAKAVPAAPAASAPTAADWAARLEAARAEHQALLALPAGSVPLLDQRQIASARRLVLLAARVEALKSQGSGDTTADAVGGADPEAVGAASLQRARRRCAARPARRPDDAAIGPRTRLEAAGCHGRRGRAGARRGRCQLATAPGTSGTGGPRPPGTSRNSAPRSHWPSCCRRSWNSRLSRTTSAGRGRDHDSRHSPSR